MSPREHLVYMANQIGRNFAVMGDVDAAAATADHIATFWDPHMREALRVDRSGLDDIATGAFRLLNCNGDPPHQTRATEFGPGIAPGGSDAG